MRDELIGHYRCSWTVLPCGGRTKPLAPTTARTFPNLVTAAAPATRREGRVCRVTARKERSLQRTPGPLATFTRRLSWRRSSSIAFARGLSSQLVPRGSLTLMRSKLSESIAAATSLPATSLSIQARFRAVGVTETRGHGALAMSR